MVIKKCNKSREYGIDWIKSLAVIAVFSGVILYSLKQSTEANAGVRMLQVETKANTEMLKTLVALHVGKRGE